MYYRSRYSFGTGVRIINNSYPRMNKGLLQIKPFYVSCYVALTIFVLLKQNITKPKCRLDYELGGCVLNGNAAEKVSLWK